MNKAIFIKEIHGWKGEVKLFHLFPPLEGHEFVVVSAADTSNRGPETFIFPTDDTGAVLDWGELEGSKTGDMNIPAALNRAGYKIEE